MESDSSNNSKAKKDRKARVPRKGRARGARGGTVADHHFASYLSFGICSTLWLGCFLLCYMLVLFILMPLLSMEVPSSNETGGVTDVEDVSLPDLHIKKYSKRVANELMKHEFGSTSSIAGNVANRLKHNVLEFKGRYGITDESLMKDAVLEFSNLRQKRQDQLVQQKEEKEAMMAAAAAANDPNRKRAGVFVLGMHRSGTSMLSGLLVQGAGYAVGSPLIGANFDNEKGFYELLPIVLQNDEFLKAQKATWSANVIAYNPDLAIEHKEKGIIQFTEGQKGMEFLSNPSNVPWVMKDPRMCITLPTWLQLLNNDKKPAALFTYRHPYESAMSLVKREKNFTFEHGIRLWIVYNMRAIQNSNNLCRITSSNKAIFENPLHELQRIIKDLTEQCNVSPPPNEITQEDIDKFIDSSLHHNKKEKNEERKLISTEQDKQNGCMIYDREEHSYKLGSANDERETKLYMIAMRMFCDMETGKIYQPDYVFAKLP